MGLTSSQFSRFSTLAERTLAELFPASITISGTTYAASGVGGAATHDYLDEGGQAPAGTRFFRVLRSYLPTAPAVGTQLTWNNSTDPVSLFTITQIPSRPHEAAWTLRCEPAYR
jgi:hypothetical protein